VNEPKTVTIDATVYQLRRWEYKDGRRWLYRIVAIIADAGAAAAGDTAAAIGAILTKLDADTFEAFCETCEKYTDVVRSKNQLVPLASIAPEHMRGRYFDLAALIKAHIEQEYGSFFDRAAALLPGAEKTAPSP
jgi:hypothetical protein